MAGFADFKVCCDAGLTVRVDPRIRVTGYRVADPPATRRASDHLPVLAELALPAAGD